MPTRLLTSGVPAALLTLGLSPAQTAPSSSALLATLPGTRQGFSERDGVSTHYVTAGRDPLVILLPEEQRERCFGCAKVSP